MKTDATHYIRCFESVGNGRKRLLFQECILLGYCGNGKAKVSVLRGVRGGNGGNVAYIDKDVKGRFIIDREIMDRLLPAIERLIIEYRDKIREL